MPGDINRRTLQFPEAPHKPAIHIQILSRKDNERADEIAAELAEKIADWVPKMVMEKVSPATVQLERNLG